MSLKPLSILSIMDEFNSIRRGCDDEIDPLDLPDHTSSCSSGPDFDALVDALVHLPNEPVASPQWLQAAM